MAADGKTPPTHPQGGGGNIMCTCSIFVCRHNNNDMSTLLGGGGEPGGAGSYICGILLKMMDENIFELPG